VRLAIPGVAGAAAKVVTAHPSFSISKQDVKQVFTSAAPQTPPPNAAGLSSSSKPPWALIVAAALGALLLGLLVFQLLRRRGTSEAAAPPAAPAPLPSEPEQQPEAEAEAAEPEPVLDEAEAAQEAPQSIAEQTRSPLCDPHHYWDVAYDRGELGDDGIWRFPHRCRNCGLELLARDVDDATAHADAA
jgi:hypothetical protein